jgi:hypothetical protein
MQSCLCRLKKGTSTPLARNGQDLHPSTDPKLDSRTLKVIWQPLIVIGVILLRSIHKKPLIFTFNYACAFCLRPTAKLSAEGLESTF